ncbi:hypothetical protein DEO72_LG9g1736 [Vigna unguiculata]|uniref:Uncharacterized protein n=1 Tax=Vigna unguiculata TaxID=3917 RepID=A0A4D6N178_VIGUN|nr:hypothetical protein DEO72_LG9g1736 [Vigna unguiculata]
MAREELLVADKEVVDAMMLFSDKMPTKGLVRVYNLVHLIIDFEGYMAQMGKKNLALFQALRKEKAAKARAVGSTERPICGHKDLEWPGRGVQICDEEWRWRCGAAKLWQVCGGGVTLLQVKVATQFVVSARFCDGREWRKMVVVRRVADLLQRRGGRGGCALQVMRRGGRR